MREPRGEYGNFPFFYFIGENTAVVRVVGVVPVFIFLTLGVGG